DIATLQNLPRGVDIKLSKEINYIYSQYFPFFILIEADFLRLDENGHRGTLKIYTQINIQSSSNSLIPRADELNAATIIQERHTQETNELTLK
ncbi:hypothetical protein C0J52_01131, partial [Blattella germanica]